MSQIDLFCCIPLFYDLTDSISENLTLFGIPNRVFKERILPTARDPKALLIVVGDNFDYDIINGMGHAEKAMLWITEMPPVKDSFCPHAEKRFTDLKRAKKHFQIFITHSLYQQRFLQSKGFQHVELVGWPFSRDCRKLNTGKSTEVFFWGALPGRRARIIDKLRENGIGVEATNDCYGADKLLKINSAKIALNIHYEEVRNFEAMRILDTMACGTFVISEKIESDELRDGEHLVLVDQDNIVSKIKYYLKHDEEREYIASRGHKYVLEHFSGKIITKKLIQRLNKYGHLKSRVSKAARARKAAKSQVSRGSRAYANLPVPEVSVVIPYYNSGRSLNKAVESVLRQTMQNFEIIVVNNGSTDEYSNKMLTNYDKPKTTIFNIKKKCTPSAKNFGISKSRGRLVLCLDPAGVLEPTCLEKALHLFKKSANTAVVTFWYKSCGTEERYFTPVSCTIKEILVENRICSSALFRKSAWKDVGGFEERVTDDLTGYDDWDFWISVLEKGYHVKVIKEFLYSFRVDMVSVIEKSDPYARRDKIVKQIIKKHRNTFQENAPAVFLGKEAIIGSLSDYRQVLQQALTYYRAQKDKNEEAIKKLFEGKKWFLQQIENYKVTLAQDQAFIADLQVSNQQLRQENSRQRAELVRNQKEIVRLNHTVDAKEHELRSIYFSKIWKLGCAFRDARRSIKGVLLLPFRIIDLACPNSIKRLTKRLLLIEPQEVIRKNFHKFPFRLLDRILPNRLKEAIPYQIRNYIRTVFKISDERLYKQKKWDGPLVSVIIPCYNYGRYLDEALQSVLRQTFPNWEVLIVDDGSTDQSTIEKLTEIEKRSYAKVKIVRQSNAGVSAARNNGIRSARGKYICCLDADDCLEPTYLEKCLLVLESRNLDLCYTHVQLIGDESWVWKTVEFDVQRILKDNCVSTAAVFKKSIWQKAGRYNTNMHHGWEDWDFWISVAEAGGSGAVIPEPLFIYRRHGETRDIKAAEEHSEILLKQIRENHRALYEGSARLPKTRRYKVTDPFINVLLEQTLPPITRDKDQILFLLPWMVVGGADNILLGLADALQENGGAQVHIITTVEPLPSMGDSTPDFLKVTPYIYKLPGLLEEALWYLYIEAYIKQRRINTIFICGCSFIYPLLSKIKRNAPHVKIIDQLFNDSPLGHVENNRRFADHIDLTIVPAEKIKTSILEKYGGKPDGIVAVYHGADSEYFDPDLVDVAESRRKFGIPDDKKVILYVGRLSVEKNPLLFLDLAAAFRNESDYLFVIRGNGSLLEAVRSRADELRLNNIMFLGIMDEEDMPHLYRLADLFVITSQVEGIPLTIFESLAMNVPVVASDVGGISDVIREGKHGYIYRPGAKEELIEKVRQALAKSFGELRGEITKRYELKDVFLNYLAVFNR